MEGHVRPPETLRVEVAPITPGAPARRRSVLLPSFGVLILIEAASLFLSGPGLALTFWVGVAVVFIAVVIVRIKEAMAAPAVLSLQDLVVCRWSGMLAPLPLFSFLSFAYYLEARGFNVNAVVFGSHIGWLAVAAVMEWGLILGVTGLTVPRGLRPLRPAWLWRPLSLLLTFVYGLYLLGTLTRGFGEMAH